MKLSGLLLLSSSVLGDDVPYSTPVPSGKYNFWEPFDAADSLDSWTYSNNDKYIGGKWAIEPLAKEALSGDNGLVLKNKAAHHALVRNLDRQIDFDGNLVIQYEVAFQSGIECGGAYMKLLSQSDDDIADFHDKTPFTIMFGPDKCGADYKLHFIFRYKNPVTGEITEKSPTKKAESSDLQKKYGDNKSHVYTLKLKTDNSFSVSIDGKVVMSGNLLSDISPPIMPDKEIDDPEDSKPEEWDERERIPDPDASKPEDWDEAAPAKIPDLSASMPSDWLEDEESMIENPDAVRPEDWDDDMDGEWMAPLIKNPACEKVSGCGVWEAPEIPNPAYKGKWKAPMIANPAYKGKWSPRKIANPDYFEDATPYKMTPVTAIGFELWTLSNDIYFDNIIITENEKEAQNIIDKTWALRKAKNSGIMDKIIEPTEGRPWLWAVYVLAIVIPLVLVIMCCCCGGESKTTDEIGQRKKTDEVSPDDPHDSDEEDSADEIEEVEKDEEEMPELEEQQKTEEPQVEKEESGAGGDAPEANKKEE